MISDTTECTLCYDDSNYLGLSECNHGPFCYRCVYKMRVISKNNSCPICKMESKQIVISKEFCKFGEFKEQILPDKAYSDVFHIGEECRREFAKLMETKCFVKINGNPCKTTKLFPNLAFLKKHLKEDHKRVLCDVCLEKKTCVLEQQKLYTQAQLNKHLQRGDIDEFGNIIFMHPYCTFCKQYFFDDDLYRVHVNLQHMICNVCGNQERYRYYKNYDSLQIHYKISHYICGDANCQAKKFIAFRSAQELKLHRSQYHNQNSNGKRMDGKELCGFQYEGMENQMENVVIKDHEGVDIHDQFLSLKKNKNRSLLEGNRQEDAMIDLRDFYESGMDEDQHMRNAFILKHRNNGQRGQEQTKKPQTGGGGGKKRKYVQKQQFQKQKPILAKQNQDFYIEDLSLLKTMFSTRLYYDTLEDKLVTLIGNEGLKSLESWRNKFNKRQLSGAEFIQNFLGLMKNVSLKSAYEIFPHYIRTVTNEHAKAELDHEFKILLRKVRSKTRCMLSRCQTYGDLFRALIKKIEQNLQERITNGSLDLKESHTREKERIFQIIGVVRKLRIEELGKFKFAPNFGIRSETTQFIHHELFKTNEDAVLKYISKIPNEEFLNVYVFTKICLQSVIHSENMHLAQSKINEHILEDFLFQHPELQKKYGQKKEDLKTLDEKVAYEKKQEEMNHKKQMKEMEKKNKDAGYHSSANFNLNDKGDFPELVQTKKSNEKQENNQNFREVIGEAKSKPATYQKKINELFPTLGSEEPAPIKKEEIVPEKKEKAWWEKINQKKVDIEEQQEVVKVRKGKNKKEKWVSVKGIFN